MIFIDCNSVIDYVQTSAQVQATAQDLGINSVETPSQAQLIDQIQALMAQPSALPPSLDGDVGTQMDITI